MPKFDYNFFEYFNSMERKIRASPLNLGGILGSGGGIGGPPGGYIGMLPQTRVAYDETEAAIAGFVSPNPYDASGVLISASLLDNLNHIRFRLDALDGGGGSTFLMIYENDVLVASGIHILDFSGSVNVADIGGGEVEIDIPYQSFTVLTDTPNNYTGHANKLVSVKSDQTGLEFITSSGGVDTFKVKVSANDTTESFLENKIVAGDDISIAVLNEGGNEQLEISVASGSIPTPVFHVIGFAIPGELSVGTYPPRVLSPWACTISEVIASVYVNGEPSGSGILVDVNKNGTTIFTNQANRPAILDGQLDSDTEIPDVTVVNKNDVFTVAVDQIGSPVPGSGLIVQVRVIV